MYRRVTATIPDECFLPISRRKQRGTFFLRITQYSDEIAEWLWKYHEAARQKGVILENQIQNPDERQLNYDLLLTDNFFVSEEDLNSDEDIINFQNGLLRLSDMTLLPHTPDQLSTIQLPCDWPPAPSETPVYDRYMQTLTRGNEEHVRLLEEFAGVCLSNIKGWRMKKDTNRPAHGSIGKRSFCR